MIQTFLTVGALHLMAVMSPGPDLALILKTSLTSTKRASLFMALGIGIGVLAHMLYTLGGFALFIAKKPEYLQIVQYAGAAYILYLGIMSLKPQSNENAANSNQKSQVVDFSDWKAFRIGLITNLLNTKAMLYFISIFSQFIGPDMPKYVSVVFTVEIFLLTWGWFTFVSLALGHPIIKSKFTAIQKPIEKVMGILLVALAIRMVF